MRARSPAAQLSSPSTTGTRPWGQRVPKIRPQAAGGDSYAAGDRARIRALLEQVQEELRTQTALRLEIETPATAPPDRILVREFAWYEQPFFEGACGLSRIGRVGGEQVVQFRLQRRNPDGDFGCLLHEFLHALGVPHEQSRRDRDDFIVIRWQNIALLAQPNFWEVPPGLFDEIREIVAPANNMTWACGRPENND